MSRKSTAKDSLMVVLFTLYIYVLFKVILFKLGPIEWDYLLYRLRHVSEHPGAILQRLEVGNLIPFKEITRGMHDQSVGSRLNLFGNIALFIPFGILLSLSGSKKKSFAGVFLRSFALSLTLECLQLLLFLGTFDVDDLILNTAGGLLGYGIYALFAAEARSSRSGTGGGKETGPEATIDKIQHRTQKWSNPYKTT